MQQESIMLTLRLTIKINLLKTQEEECNSALDSMYRDVLQRFTQAQAGLSAYPASQETYAADRFAQLISEFSLTGKALHDISQLVDRCKPHVTIDESSIKILNEAEQVSYFERENAFWETAKTRLSILQAELNPEEQGAVSKPQEAKASIMGYFGTAGTSGANGSTSQFVRLEDVEFSEPSPSHGKFRLPPLAPTIGPA